jgi:hypothetical protein
VTVRCVIVDDNQDFLEAARTLLERQGMAMAGLASSSVDQCCERELRAAQSGEPASRLQNPARFRIGYRSGFG